MDFTEFFDKCSKNLGCYHSKYVSDNYNISENLQSNIHNYSEFKKFFYLLTNSKLYIRCIRNFDLKLMFDNYILPSAIFLYYMKVDISKLTNIELFLVDDRSYERYKCNEGGVYTMGENKRSKKPCHIVFVKYYKDNTRYNQLDSINSLFHELTHLVDNSDNSDNSCFKNCKCIEYRFRWHEIKAKYISEFFILFYAYLISTGFQYNRSILIKTINSINTQLDDHYFKVNNLLNSNYKYVDSMLKYPSKTSYSIMFKYSKENIQLIKSLQLIEQIQTFFYNVGEILEK